MNAVIYLITSIVASVTVGVEHGGTTGIVFFCISTMILMLASAFIQK